MTYQKRAKTHTQSHEKYTFRYPSRLGMFVNVCVLFSYILINITGYKFNFIRPPLHNWRIDREFCGEIENTHQQTTARTRTHSFRKHTYARIAEAIIRPNVVFLTVPPGQSNEQTIPRLQSARDAWRANTISIISHGSKIHKTCVHALTYGSASASRALIPHARARARPGKRNATDNNRVTGNSIKSI